MENGEGKNKGTKRGEGFPPQLHANGNDPSDFKSVAFHLTMEVFLQRNPFLRLISKYSDLAYFFVAVPGLFQID